MSRLVPPRPTVAGSPRRGGRGRPGSLRRGAGLGEGVGGPGAIGLGVAQPQGQLGSWGATREEQGPTTTPRRTRGAGGRPSLSRSSAPAPRPSAPRAPRPLRATDAPSEPRAAGRRRASSSRARGEPSARARTSRGWTRREEGERGARAPGRRTVPGARRAVRAEPRTMGLRRRLLLVAVGLSLCGPLLAARAPGGKPGESCPSFLSSCPPAATQPGPPRAWGGGTLPGDQVGTGGSISRRGVSPLHPQPQFPSEAKQAFGLRSRFSPVLSGRDVPIHPSHRFGGSAAAPLPWVLEGAPACGLGAGYGGRGGGGCPGEACAASWHLSSRFLPGPHPKDSLTWPQQTL